MKSLNTELPPTVTIGLPVYNGERHLEETLTSLRSQTFTDFELVISDNCSTDGTISIIQRHASVDPRVRVLQNSRNVGANRNYLAVQKAARGRYFKWAACGDLCATTFLEECVQILEARPDVVLAVPRTSLFYRSIDDAQPYAEDIALDADDAVARLIGLLSDIRLNNLMNGLIRRTALDRALPLGVFWGADTLLFAEIALMGKFALIDQRLFLRRMAPETATCLRTHEQIEAHLDPVRESGLTWQRWRYCLRLIRIAARSTPTMEARCKALIAAVRVLIWSRRELARELRFQMRHGT